MRVKLFRDNGQARASYDDMQNPEVNKHKRLLSELGVNHKSRYCRRVDPRTVRRKVKKLQQYQQEVFHQISTVEIVPRDCPLNLVGRGKKV